MDTAKQNTQENNRNSANKTGEKLRMKSGSRGITISSNHWRGESATCIAVHDRAQDSSSFGCFMQSHHHVKVL